uniref:non-specific serine/threonine protein kinase n=1 Tax=Leersia perrieri TaxID=77586 RepID=A0A0D9X3Z2_9ORYZ
MVHGCISCFCSSPSSSSCYAACQAIASLPLAAWIELTTGENLPSGGTMGSMVYASPLPHPSVPSPNLSLAPAAVAALSFNYINFGPDEQKDIRLEGDAAFSGDGGRWIDVSANRLTGGIAHSRGCASYARPIPQWDKDTGEMASFTTTFSFVIDPQDINNKGTGMAFFLACYPSRLPSAGSWAYNLGGLASPVTNQTADEIATGDDRLAATAAVSFNFSTFSNMTQNITLQGSASAALTAGTTGWIELTTGKNSSSSGTGTMGRVVYTPPVQLWDAATGEVASFTTRFSFNISPKNKSNKGDGMTFFLVSYPSRMPYMGFGGALGLTSQKFDNATAGDRFVAVEFDTYNNSFLDPDATYDHIGIDVNSLRSVKTESLPSFILIGNMTAIVDYNSNSSIMSVKLWANGSTTPYNLSSKVDLKSALPEKVAVGFSAATGSAIEQHQLHSWYFNLSLEQKQSTRVKSPLPSHAGVIAGVTVGAAVFAMLLFTAVVFLRRRQRKKMREEENDSSEGDPIVEIELGTGPRRFSYHVLVNATKNFAAEEKLGQGGFGTVYRGYLRELGLAVAIKRFAKHSSKQGRKEYKSEINVISRLRHRNLVQLIGWCHGRNELLLVYELVPNCSLDVHLHGDGTFLTWPMRINIVLGLGSALLYLHEEWEQCVVHRDIKPSNVMLDESFNAKLGDFGLARLIDHAAGIQTMTHPSGTPGYIDPECIITGKASAESDVYSFGIVILEVACGRRPMALMDDQNNGLFRLVEWVWDLYGQGTILKAADKSLNSDYDAAAMERAMAVGLWCAHPDRCARPSIRAAMSVLQSDGPLPVLPAKMPVPTYAPPAASSEGQHSSSTGMSCLLLPHVATLSFNYSSFTQANGNTIKLEGDASFGVGWIDISANRYNDIQYSKGRASYNAPMLLWNKDTGEVASFTTRFSFVINTPKDIGGINNKGTGMAFFLAAYPSMIPDGRDEYGYNIGLTNQSTDAVATGNNRFVAVEFDTFNNTMVHDPDATYDHLGIDINSVVSSKTLTLDSFTLTGNMSAVIEYDNASSILAMKLLLGYGRHGPRNGTYNLSYKVDLKSVLPEQVLVGFSASTTTSAELHQLHSWYFSSTLEPPLPSPTPTTSGSGHGGVVAGATVSAVLFSVLLFAVATVVVLRRWIKKRRSAEEVENGSWDGGDDDGEPIMEIEMGTGPKRFPYHELVKATNSFASEEKLGQGGFGAVYRGYLREEGLVVAIKRFAGDSSKQGRREYKSEIKVISRLRHRNLVQLIGWCHGRAELLLVYELVPNRSLDIHLHGNGTFLTWPMRIKIILGLGSALFYLHEEWEQCVVHRDIKPSNVMLDESFNSKLGDFGLARFIDHNVGIKTMTAVSGTPGYVDPECLITGKVACGRRPMSLLDNHKNSIFRLVEWVWDLYGRGAPLMAADERLNSCYDTSEMESVIVVGLWCAHPDPSARPSIRAAMAVLQSNGPLPVLPTKMPVPTYAPPVTSSEGQLSLSTGMSSSSWTLTSVTPR